jgi:hypothetical protein
MIERAVIHVGGPPGAGKTMLIESLLRSYDGLVLVARCVRDDSLRSSRETAPKRHPEMRRYREAGASGAALFRFPSADIDSDAFYTTDLMQDYSQAIVVEGDSPFFHADLCVFVAPALEGRSRLLVRRTRDRAAEARGALDSTEQLLRQPAGMQKLMTQVLGHKAASLVPRASPATEKARTELLAAIDEMRSAPPPEPTEHWALADGYAGIGDAQVVVTNTREGADADGAVRLLADLQRIRKDEEVFDDILGWRGTRSPITAVAANLGDAADPGTRKALARIRRSIRRVAEL